MPNLLGCLLLLLVGALQIPAVTTFMNQVLAYLPNVIATIVPALVMVIAMFMILNQLKIVEEDVARRMLEDAYNKSRDAKEQAKRDFETGRARAEESTGYASSSDGQHLAGSTATTGSTYDYDATQNFTTPDQALPPTQRY